MFRSIRSIIVAAVCVLAFGMVTAPSPVFAAPTAETADTPLPVVVGDPSPDLARSPGPNLESTPSSGRFGPHSSGAIGSARLLPSPDGRGGPPSLHGGTTAPEAPAPADAECAAIATIDWGDEELTGVLYSDTCVEVSIKIFACSWCSCAYIVETPGGSYYTFHDTDEGGGLECGFASPITFY